MSWIQTTADTLSITYYESLGIYVGVTVLVVAWCYFCCILPIANCFKCFEAILCFIPKTLFGCCKSCLMSKTVDAVFEQGPRKNKYKPVQTIDIYDDESERGPMV